MNLKFIKPQNLGSLLMKPSQSNFDLRSPGSCLVCSYLITTVQKIPLGSDLGNTWHFWQIYETNYEGIFVFTLWLYTLVWMMIEWMWEYLRISKRYASPQFNLLITKHTDINSYVMYVPILWEIWNFECCFFTQYNYPFIYCFVWYRLDWSWFTNMKNTLFL